MLIRMPPGHTQLSLGGHLYTPDDTGAFDVPDQYVAELKRVHGATEETSIQQYEQAVVDADAAVGATKALLERRHVEARTARETLAKAKEKSKKDAEAQALLRKNAEEARAKTEADAALLAKATGPVSKAAA